MRCWILLNLMLLTAVAVSCAGVDATEPVESDDIRPTGTLPADDGSDLVPVPPSTPFPGTTPSALQVMDGLVGEQAKSYVEARTVLKNLTESSDPLAPDQYKRLGSEPHLVSEITGALEAFENRASDFHSALRTATPPAECEQETEIMAILVTIESGLAAWLRALVDSLGSAEDEALIQPYVDEVSDKRDAAVALFQEVRSESNCSYFADLALLHS